MSGYVRKPVMGTVLTDRMGAATARWRCLPLSTCLQSTRS